MAAISAVADAVWWKDGHAPDLAPGRGRGSMLRTYAGAAAPENPAPVYGPYRHITAINKRPSGFEMLPSPALRPRRPGLVSLRRKRSASFGVAMPADVARAPVRDIVGHDRHRLAARRTRKRARLSDFPCTGSLVWPAAQAPRENVVTRPYCRARRRAEQPPPGGSRFIRKVLNASPSAKRDEAQGGPRAAAEATSRSCRSGRNRFPA